MVNTRYPPLSSPSSPQQFLTDEDLSDHRLTTAASKRSSSLAPKAFHESIELAGHPIVKCSSQRFPASRCRPWPSHRGHVHRERLVGHRHFRLACAPQPLAASSFNPQPKARTRLFGPKRRGEAVRVLAFGCGLNDCGKREPLQSPLGRLLNRNHSATLTASAVNAARMGGSTMCRLLATTPFLSVLAAPLFAAVIGQPKTPYQDLADDRPKSHVELIVRSGQEYRIPFLGSVNGTITRMPVGYAAFKQGWQPNRSVRIDNIGDTDVQNPWVMLNGRGDWRTLAAVVAEATRGAETKAEKARTLYEFVRRRRFHACTWDNECSDAIKALNVYGYTLCGNQAIVLRDLWNAAGLKTRRCRPIGHSVAEVFYDGAFHMLDSDEHVMEFSATTRPSARRRTSCRDHGFCSSELTPTVSRPRIAARRTEFSASLYVFTKASTRGRFGARNAAHRWT